MSNLKSASLVLKTADLIDNTKNYLVGTISGYFSSTTQLMVSNITTGLLPTFGSLNTTTSTLKYYGGTENTTGAVSLSSTTTATTATATQTCTLSGGFILQIATLTVTGCTIAGTNLTLGSSQTLIAGQYISGSGIIPGTTIVSGSGTAWVISASHTIGTATSLSFFTPNTSIIANLGVSSTNVSGIYTVGGVVFNTSGNPQWQHSGPVLTYGSRTCTFYPLTQYTVYSFDPLSSTQVGSCNNIRSLYSWNNLNLRTILGDMWDKYSSFNLCLEYIGTSYPIIPNSNTNTDNLAVNIKMSGFNFINSTYEIKNNCNVSNIVISPFYFSTSTPSNVYLSNASQYTFLKNNDIFNINIEYERIVDGKSPLNTTTGIINSSMNVPYPNMIYIFKIFGCDPIDTNNASRIKNI